MSSVLMAFDFYLRKINVKNSIWKELEAFLKRDRFKGDF
jgi:hypothetical protein